MENSIAVLYSKEQKSWHIETLQDYCFSNIRFIFEKSEAQQFRLITIVNSKEQAHKFVKDNRNLFFTFDQIVNKIVVCHIEEDRTTRLKRVCQFVITEMFNKNLDVQNFVSLFDHKGEFNVLFEMRMLPNELFEFEKIFKCALEKENEHLYKISYN